MTENRAQVNKIKRISVLFLVFFFGGGFLFCFSSYASYACIHDALERIERRKDGKNPRSERQWLIPLFAFFKQGMLTFEESGRKSSRKEYKM